MTKYLLIEIDDMDQGEVEQHIANKSVELPEKLGKELLNDFMERKNNEI